MKITIATQNKKKIQEISAILREAELIIPSQQYEIEEKTNSYIENAFIKAEFWHILYPGNWVLSDDSGIEISVLNDRPGVISADWAGKNSTQQNLIKKVLEELKDIPFELRTARYVCYMMLMSPEKNIFVSRGECLGRIALTVSGTEGFGYDPVFLPMEYDYRYSMSELSPEQKNNISHRYKALVGIKDYLKYIEA
ncbi:MAG: non-canonical purine NTP pyrophosphatase [Brevinemataceae bacterium]